MIKKSTFSENSLTNAEELKEWKNFEVAKSAIENKFGMYGANKQVLKIASNV